MDGAAESDHSMTWEDFFGSTTDLTPTLIGIYDSLLEPSKPNQASNKPQATSKAQAINISQAPSNTQLTINSQEPSKHLEQNSEFRPQPSRLHDNTKPCQAEIHRRLTEAKDARTDPPNIDNGRNASFAKNASKISGGIKLPDQANTNKSSLYARRTNNSVTETVNDGANVNSVTSVSVNETSFLHRVSVQNKSMKDQRLKMLDAVGSSHTSFENLSPTVKRMISGASDSTASNPLKHQNKKQFSVRASVRGHKSNIPLVGATSKISQSGVEILDSVEIYDQPTLLKTSGRSQSVEDERTPQELPVKTVPLKPEFRIEPDAPTTYDVPKNLEVIYDVPSPNSKTAFESLSLPYIDQSLELSISSTDREFDIKLTSKDNSPEQPKTSTPKNSPLKSKAPLQVPGTNSLHRKEVLQKTDASPKQLKKSGPYPDAIGSTGNLKLCTVPEKEVPRLNPPTVEVSRPLSMSSIASSSSTSSSGAQNKGGVNSAYLASIESLDDHSDADMVSANGSNNFVNSTGMLNASNSEQLHSQMNRDEACGERERERAGVTQLQRVCAEIVETENVYVEDLRQVVEGYLRVWRDHNTFSAEELAELFNNIEDIYAFNRSLCERLNTCRLDPHSLARQFVDNTAGFSVYTSYCTGYPRTMARLAEMASCAVGARACRERQAALQHALPLGSYLLKPVQRILKYHLLLQNLVKQCRSPETEYALLKMTGIAQHIDDMKRRHEHAVRVQEIQSLLYGWSGPDLTTYGELCAEGTFRVFGAKAMRHAFLFDKMLLLTKNREDGILAYKSHIMCNNLMLVESIAGAPLSFHVIPWDAPRAQLTLQARSQRHKREWTLLLKRVILENYNAVIPSHARQLVMELGQNKTDDDILAEKSHNLITHASMRKQLSAPEYLEKRKLERERRKTFDNSRLKKSIRKSNVLSNAVDSQDACDCAQVSREKGTDFTCESCYIDLCSECELELSTKDKEPQCNCKTKYGSEKCPECDRSLHYIDAGSTEHLERKQACCKCSDFNSSQESFGKEYSGSLSNTRGYHSSDNIVGYTEKGKDDLGDVSNVKSLQKTCLKCAKIKENIAITSSGSGTVHRRKSRCNELEKLKTETMRSKSKDDSQRTKLSKISTWRRKSEPGLENGSIIANIVVRKANERNDSERAIDVPKGYEKIEFECRNCGSCKINKKQKVENADKATEVDSSVDYISRKSKINSDAKPNSLEVRMYNTKHVPKKISKLKKSRAKGMRFGSDMTAKFYADFSTDVSTENILHISESTDSINTTHDKAKDSNENLQVSVAPVKHDSDIDEETYRKLIEKTDSFKKNELEKVKYLNQQKVINETAECESDKQNEPEKRHKEDDENESGEESEKPLEQIISQLLMQNREFQKILKKQQLRNGAQRRHQRLLKSHSNPEQVLAARNKEQHKMRPKYGRQTSENLKLNTSEVEHVSRLSPQKELDDGSDDDHIYETLRVEQKLHLDNDDPPLASPSPPPTIKKETSRVNSRLNVLDTDYVYLSFEKVASQVEEDDGIYDVPSSIPVEKSKTSNPANTDYYVSINNQSNDNIYDQILEACKREVDHATTVTSGEYLPMSKDQQNPNAPEIWVSRQKEHFKVSRERKSGSLPRSFQVVTSHQDESSLSTFKAKPNGANKTYLNRDGKVMSVDRPFTIASDKSEISYDDVENYMNDDDVLKYNKPGSNRNSFFEPECADGLSRSTLELEEEIDRCYKNNIEKKLESDKNRNLLSNSQQNLDISITSSCEVLSPEKLSLESTHAVNLVHPEHKIYKPNTNLLSFKNVLSRFKNKNPNKNSFDNEQEINANEQNTLDMSPKSDVKSPTSNEKRSALNPRSYSKNLLQRFKNIIGDEQPEGTQAKSVPLQISAPLSDAEINQNNVLTSDIKPVITLTDFTPTTSTIFMTTNTDLLSKSVCEKTTLGECLNEKKQMDTLSHSCDNIQAQPTQTFKPIYDKSISMVTSIPNSIHSSPSKLANSSYQSLHKLPIYKQGSKNLGARIAQSDYVDPQTLFPTDSKMEVNNVNILINKNAVRPDSLLSNSSFVTSSSEGISEHARNMDLSKSVIDENTSEEAKSGKFTFDLRSQGRSDESFYEKSFEKIENIADLELFRDSAVYSDQEDSDDIKIEIPKSSKRYTRNSSRLETMKRNASFKSDFASKNISLSMNESKCKAETAKTEIKKTTVEKVSSDNLKNNKLASKIAPPVPVKPKLLPPPKSTRYPKSFNKASTNTLQRETSSSIETLNTKTVQRNSSFVKSFIRSDSVVSSESVSISDSTKSETLSRSESVKASQVEVKVESVSVQPTTRIPSSKPTDHNKAKTASSSLQMKRLTFERTSLDSATRKSKIVEPEINKKSNADVPKLVSKSVLERRLEIESISKTVMQDQPTISKQLIKPKPIFSRMASYQRSNSDNTQAIERNNFKRSGSVEKASIPNSGTSIPSAIKETRSEVTNLERNENVSLDGRESWVKTIVNKFQ